MANSNRPEYSHWLTIATIIFFVWSSMFTGVRIWAKVIRSFQWSLNDSIFATAFVVGVGECICIFLAVSNGFGQDPNDLSLARTNRVEKVLFASDILYTMCIGLSKVSTVLFLGSLTRNAKQKRAGYVLASICAAWTAACSPLIALRGDLSKPWATQPGSQLLFDRWLGIETSGLGIEAVLWSYSITLVWGLNLSRAKRIKVSALFAVRFTLVPLIAGRLYFLSPTHQAGSADSHTLFLIFTQGAMQYSLMSECMTCLKPFLQAFHSSWGYSNGDGFSNPSHDPYSELTNLSRSDGRELKKEVKIGQREVAPEDNRKSGTKMAQGQWSQATAGDGQLWSAVRAPSNDDEIELLQRNQMGIQRTTTVSITKEERSGA